MRVRSPALLIGVLLSCSLVASAARADSAAPTPAASAGSPAPISPSTILANPSAYDGKHVDVAGSIQSYEERATHDGSPWTGFDLCDSVCVHVLFHSHPGFANAQQVTVHGTFRIIIRLPTGVYHNWIEADS